MIRIWTVSLIVWVVGTRPGELGGSLGAGFPSGRKGTTLDLSFQGGKRFADSGRAWDEIFLGFRIGLMGVGNWGQTR